LAVPHKRKVVLPTVLAHCKPGELPANMLVEVKPYGKLLFCAADAWMAFKQRAHQEGIAVFKPTSANDCYRSVAIQTIAWNDRMTTEPLPGVKPRVYQGKNFYLKPGKAPIAQPGRSNHNWGISVDVHTASGERLEFMKAHALEYGFTWELDSEPWHINYFRGDRVPKAVTAWKNWKALQ
jgi:hypothetical protein